MTSTSRLSFRESPLAWIVAVGALGLGGGGAGASWLVSPKEELKEIKATQKETLDCVQKLDRRMEKLEDAQTEAYSRQKFEVWCLKLQRDNQALGLKVPEVNGD